MKHNHKIILFSTITLFALLISTVVATYSISKISKEYTSERLSALSKDVERSINDVITQTVDISRTIANDTFLTQTLEQEKDADPYDISEVMAEYTSRLEKIFSYEWIFIASDATKAYYTNDGLYSILNTSSIEDFWYQEFVDQNTEYTVSVGTDNDEPMADTIFVDVRIESASGKFLGVCGVAVKMDSLKEVIGEYESEYGVSVQFIDDNKVSMLSGDDVDFDDIDLDTDQKEEILVNRKGIFENDYTIVKYIEQLEWYMVIRDYDPFNQTVDFFLIVFTTISSIIMIVIAVISLSYIVKRNNALYTTSYSDDMTGLYNRRAYDDRRRELRKKESMKKYAVVVFDVNGLKRANDTLGHFAGDELIRGAAKLIREVFDEKGRCFRTGGDEFVAILEGEGIDEQVLLKRFESLVSEWNGEYLDSMSISYGAVNGKDNPEWTIDELTALADERMYWQKREYYKTSGRDRRRA